MTNLFGISEESIKEDTTGEFFDDVIEDGSLNNANHILDMVDNASLAMEDLELLNNKLKDTKNDEVVDCIQIAVEALKSQLGYENKHISIETHENKKITLEASIVEITKKVWKVIIDAFKKAYNWVKDFFYNIFSRKKSLEAKLQNVLDLANDHIKKNKKVDENTKIISEIDKIAILFARGENKMMFKPSDFVIAFQQDVNNQIKLYDEFKTLFSDLEEMAFKIKKDIEIKSNNNDDDLKNDIVSDSIKRFNFTENEYVLIKSFLNHHFEKDQGTFGTKFGVNVFVLETSFFKEKFNIRLSTDSVYFSYHEAINSNFLHGDFNTGSISILALNATQVKIACTDALKYLKHITEKPKELDIFNQYIKEVEKIDEDSDKFKSFIKICKFSIHLLTNLNSKTLQNNLKFLNALELYCRKSLIHSV